MTDVGHRASSGDEPAVAARQISSTRCVVRRANRGTVALITDMNEPLASAAGNAVEIRNAVDYLTGAHRDPRLHEVTVSLGAELLALRVSRRTSPPARAALEKSLASGAAAERFARMVAALGGPGYPRQARAILPAAPIVARRAAARGLRRSDRRARGRPRRRRTRRRPRARVRRDRSGGRPDAARGSRRRSSADAPIALVHARDEAQADAAIAGCGTAYRIGDAPPAARPVVARIAGRGVSLLVAVTGWDAAPWLARLAALLPGHEIARRKPSRIAPACATR